MPKISIIIPVYNCEEYICRALDSVINQTLKDIEIICVDDGSIDCSLEILEEYASLDKRIKLSSQKHNGVSYARNIGLELATGDYIMFLDSDDWLELNACDEAYNISSKYNFDILLFNYYFVEDGKKSEHWVLKKLENYTSFYFDNCPNDFYYQSCTVWGKLFKNNKNKIRFYEGVVQGGDSIYYWQNCFNKPKIGILCKPLYNYFRNANSISNNIHIYRECLILNAIKILTNLDEFKKSDIKHQLYILDRYAKSLYTKLKENLDEVSLPNAYYNKIYKFIRLFKKYKSKDLRKLKYYKKLKNELTYKKHTLTVALLRNIFSAINENNHKLIKVFGFKIKINREKLKIRKFIKYILNKQNKYMQDSFLLFDNLHDTTVESIDAYSLFEFMQQSGLKSYYVTLKDSALHKKLIKNKKMDNIIVINESPRKAPDDFFLEY